MPHTWEEHIKQLYAVFERLFDANLALYHAKYEFGQATVTYLGKVVSLGKVNQIHLIMEAILSFPYSCHSM